MKTHRKRVKHWSLGECLDIKDCPLDDATKQNLKFLLELRHEIEHEMSMKLDAALNPRYQACAMNYAHFVRHLFGDDKSIDDQLSFAIQLRALSREQVQGVNIDNSLPAGLRAFIAEFESRLDASVLQSDRYALNIHFERVSKNHASGNSTVVPVGGHSTDSEDVAVAFKDREKPKLRAKDVIVTMQKDGFSKFNQHHHTTLWKAMNAKSPGTGFGVEVCGQWFWYESWVEVVRQHCSDNHNYYQ